MEVTVKRDPEHVFLGMNILYKNNGTAEIMMQPYLEESIAESGMNITRKAATPVKRDLFKIDEKAVTLDTKEAEIFTVSLPSFYT